MGGLPSDFMVIRQLLVTHQCSSTFGYSTSLAWVTGTTKSFVNKEKHWS